MIGRCQEISKSSSTKSLNIHLLLLLSNTPYRRLFVERRCQSRLTPTDCNLYVSHLKNTHIRRCQLPAQCCHACVSITAPPSLLTIKPSAVLQLQPFACQSVTKLSRTRLRQHQALALEVFSSTFEWPQTFATEPWHMQNCPSGGERSLLSLRWGEYTVLYRGGRFKVNKQGPDVSNWRVPSSRSCVD